MAAELLTGWNAGGVHSGLIIIAIGWPLGWWLLLRVPTLRPSPPRTDPADATTDATSAVDLTDVTLVIPARNEADNLPLLLASLLTGELDPSQIIVVDDDSDDATASVARRFGVTVVEAGALPGGWTGKPWACMQGASAATGSILVFLDADVRMLPGGLAAVVADQQRTSGLLSVQPYHRMQRAYERLSAMFNAIAVIGVGVATPRRRTKTTGAFGPCIVCDASDYWAVGGHGAVRNEILEDLALGKVFAEAGHPVRGMGGAGTVEYRMYPGGPGQLVEGWSKNMASGSAHIGRIRMLATVMWISAAVVASVYTLQWLTGTGSLSWTQVLPVYLAVAVQLRAMFSQLGNFGWWPVVIFPVPVVAFVVVFFNSLWLTVVRRQVRWRGRSVPLSPDGGTVRRTREA